MLTSADYMELLKDPLAARPALERKEWLLARSGKYSSIQ